METSGKRSCLFLGESRRHGSSAYDGANILECVDGRWEIMDSSSDSLSSFGP
jgi:hypothetical protein